MERAVERDEQSRSNDPIPSQDCRHSNARDCLLEIVNFSVEGQQYVGAGELVALQALMNVLNYLKMQKVDVTKLTETFGLAKVKEMLEDIVDSFYESALEK
ncbi:hypothetical protein BC827DRAFT_1266983 [Russula dissimulans]|nr:hypothetical protein BC827DRAFT_1266983 [Russula dissimulans]